MRFVILGSGYGSNAEAVLRAWKQGTLGSAEPVAIFSDRADARILSLGEIYCVPACFLDPGPFRTKLGETAERAYIDAIQATGAELVVLAGFMRVIKPPFIEAFQSRIINLHPSLLPSFKGLHAIRQAFEFGVKITGCTVHFVTGDLDGGPIIDQEPVRIEPGDSLPELEERVHAAEHRLLPAVLRQMAAAVPAN